MRRANPTRSFASALLDFPAQVLLILLGGAALGGAAILLLDHAPDVLVWLRDMATA